MSSTGRSDCGAHCQRRGQPARGGCRRGIRRADPAANRVSGTARGGDAALSATLAGRGWAICPGHGRAGRCDPATERDRFTRPVGGAAPRSGENRQRVHCVVTPALSPLLDDAGTTWFPAAESSPPALLLAPGEVSSIAVQVELPNELPHRTYRGALLLQGFRHGGVPVAIAVTEKTVPDTAVAAPSRRPLSARARTTGRASRRSTGDKP